MNQISVTNSVTALYVLEDSRCDYLPSPGGS